MGDRAYTRIAVSTKDREARKLLEDEYGYNEILRSFGLYVSQNMARPLDVTATS